MNLELYLDESGEDGTSPEMMVVAGYFFAPDAARSFERKWQRMLARFDVPHFHMVDVAMGNGHFRKLGKEGCIKLQMEAMRLINENALGWLAVDVPVERFRGSADLANPYPSCLDQCVRQFELILSGWKTGAKGNPSVGKIFYEAGHRHSGEAMQLLRERKSSLINSTMSLRKDESGLLQAADIIAYQTAKFLKCALDGRPFRKDFEFLMRVRGWSFTLLPMEGAVFAIEGGEVGNTTPQVRELLRSVYDPAVTMEQLLTTLLASIESHVSTYGVKNTVAGRISDQQRSELLKIARPPGKAKN